MALPASDESFLHLTSGPSAADAVRAALVLLERDEEVFGLGDAFTMGPLGDVDGDAASRVTWWTLVRGHPLERAEAAQLDDSATWQRVLGDHSPVVIWHGPHPHERLYALRACWRLRDQPARMHEVRLGVRPPRHPNGWVAPPFYSAVAMVGPALLADAWRRCAPVSDVEGKARQWEQIRAHPDASFRELDGDEFVHLPLDAYDAPLVAACRGAWRASMLVIGQVLAVTPTGDGALAWRLRELLTCGVLEGRGTMNRLGLPEEVRPA